MKYVTFYDFIEKRIKFYELVVASCVPCFVNEDITHLGWLAGRRAGWLADQIPCRRPLHCILLARRLCFDCIEKIVWMERDLS